MKKLKRKQKVFIANVVVIALILCGLGWIFSLFVHFGAAYTDNAQVHRNLVPVNSRIQGFVKQIRFDDFEHFSKGDTLILIEDAEYQLQLAQARANYQNAIVAKSAMQTTIKTTQNNVLVSDAALHETQIHLHNALTEYKRYKELLSNGSATQQQFDAIETKYKALKAQEEVLQRQHKSTQLVESEQTQRLEQNQVAITVAEAALQLARLNLSYTVITAPCDGYTSRKQLDTGELIQAGQNLISIVSDEDCRIMANFRERQIKNIAVGSQVRIKIDAVPDVEFSGRVVAISQAAGSQYSIVPQDNSTGNFVKVEQRIPVKIALTANNSRENMAKLGAGMNAECEIIGRQR